MRGIVRCQWLTTFECCLLDAVNLTKGKEGRKAWERANTEWYQLYDLRKVVAFNGPHWIGESWTAYEVYAVPIMSHLDRLGYRGDDNEPAPEQRSEAGSYITQLQRAGAELCARFNAALDYPDKEPRDAWFEVERIDPNEPDGDE